jgi:hypothetical protein
MMPSMRPASTASLSVSTSLGPRSDASMTLRASSGIQLVE